MAKKVIDNDTKKPGSAKEEVALPQPEKGAETLAPAKGAEAPNPPQEIPAQADRILRTFTRYPELYIDFQGGTFTVDTPPAFRSNATRYTNPYYKS